MTNRDTDPEILRLFEAERLADEAAAPDLDALLARTELRQAGARPLRRIALASAIAAAVAIAVIFLATLPRRSTPGSPDLPPATMELARWKAPTDTLLQTPGSDLWTSVPDLTPPVSATGTGIPLETTKGVER
jgi:hypothetical protein